MSEKIYSRINQLKDYRIPNLSQEEFKIIDFMTDKNTQDPKIGVVDKINYKKMSAAYAGQTDLELIKKIARGATKDKLEQATYIATHLDEANTGVQLSEQITATSPVEAIMQLEASQKAINESLSKLPKELAQFIKENPNKSVSELQEFINATYKQEDKPNG